MTGIERLHKLIADIDVSADPELWYILRDGTEGGWDCEKNEDKTLGSTLAAIADQIEREQRGRVSFMRVLAVVTDMERHVSGVEGMEDSPVARWARELRVALGGNGRDHAADVSMSAYALLSAGERETISWVREHGGMDYVKSEWRSRVPYDRYERRRQRLLDHIAECETALGRRNVRIEELGHRVSDLTSENAELRRRAMPEGCEWPRYESGEPVRIGDKIEDIEVRSIVFNENGILLSDCTSVPGWGTWRSYKEPIKRPSVPAADGEPLEVGQTVWETDAEVDTPLTVVEVSSDLVRCEYTWKDGKTYSPCYPPSVLTHTKPEPPDSAERIADDIKRMAEEWCSYPSLREASEKAASSVGEATMGVALGNLSKRCRALAERERGE